MIDNFRADLIVQVNESEWSRESILKKMGYHKPSATNLERLQKVLSSPTLGLDVGGYDLRYQSHEFVHELCRALELPLDECDANIARIKRQAEDDRAAFKPYLWVDTDFKRKCYSKIKELKARGTAIILVSLLTCIPLKKALKMAS